MVRLFPFELQRLCVAFLRLKRINLAIHLARVEKPGHG